MDDNNIHHSILQQIKNLMGEMSLLGWTVIVLLLSILITGIIALNHFW
ncbi:MAG TPA: hypothetical protein VJJ24_02600 [Candidatus Paceibacterota bacterium]|nr:MAG: hypothetical protein UV94_C0010G0029 [Parcubacteria group bacterium GW2011_GWC1_43_30]